MSATRGKSSPTRVENDAYYTPDALALAVLRALDDRPSGMVVEPSVGGGSWARAVRALNPEARLVGVDIDRRAEGLALCDEAVVGDWQAVGRMVGAGADWIVGNPPYSDLERHVRLSLELGTRVVVLVRLGWLAGRRRQDLFVKTPPRQVIVLTPRPSFVPGGGTDSADYCAIYWSAADVDLRMIAAQSTRITFLDWRPVAAAKAAA
jgi:hypothetical protein